MPQSVLVAEDEQSIAESLAFLMEKAGLEVRIAYDGTTALQMVADSRPDLVLLDLMLPGQDGFEVLKAVRANPRWRDVRVLILTAKGREIDRRKAMELGVDDYVTKPFSTREVVDRVKALLPPAED
ncbi:response regulator transcription factor [Ferruginivarius sediminum]|uniref:Response regulator n=1 Tax=Ferruginivarius sediminum TaxID=2661937 RepID=A0A369TA48_9PROT|nr:response regulator [Ferruginivarius sediminum]RDD61732.1 response regulator [Ferruginivarius sediminum]